MTRGYGLGTATDEETIAFIQEYVVRNGSVPTLRELMVAVRVRSTNSIWNRIQRLIEAGKLVRPLDRPGYMLSCPHGHHPAACWECTPLTADEAGFP